MPRTLAEWFHLNAGRSSFKPNVQRDRQSVFCHESQINGEIVMSIERRFAAGQTVKMVVYGDWGVGKTHSINHVSWWFEQNSTDYPAKTVIVELGDITSKSRFDQLVGPFLERIGLRDLIRLVHGYQGATGKHVVADLKSKGVSGNVAEAFGKLLLASPEETPPPAVVTSFDFLRGIRSRESTNIGLGEPLTQSEDFYSVLLACGHLVRAVEKRQLIFVADEAAKLEDIDNDDATRRHWIAANRAIFDDGNDVFGFIYTLSGKGQKNIPQVISDTQIVSRLGSNNLIELKNLDPTDVTTFLAKLRDAFVDRAAVETAVSSGEISATDYDWSRYPFTNDGWREFLDYWNMNQEQAKPREICDKLDDVGFRAMKDDLKLIGPDSLRKAKM
jgi:hypothetical protein